MYMYSMYYAYILEYAFIHKYRTFVVYRYMNLHDTWGMKYVNWQPSNTCNTSLYQLINSIQTCIIKIHQTWLQSLIWIREV